MPGEVCQPFCCHCHPCPFFLPGFAGGGWRGWDRCSRGNGSRGLTAPGPRPRTGPGVGPPWNRRAAVRPPGRWGAPAATCLPPVPPRGGGAALGGWPKAGGGLVLRGGACAGRSPPPPLAEVLAAALSVAPDAIPLSRVSRPRAGTGLRGLAGGGVPGRELPGTEVSRGARLAAVSGSRGLVGRVPYGGGCGATGLGPVGELWVRGLAAGPG